MLAAPLEARTYPINKAIQRLAQQLLASTPEKPNLKLAILPFSPTRERPAEFGRYIAEKLLTTLYESKRFKLVERGQLEKVLEELKLGASGVVDANTVQQIGKLLGAALVGTGTYTWLGKTVDVNARFIETETGEVIGAASTLIRVDRTTKALLEEEIPNLPPPAPVMTQFSYSHPAANAVYLSGDFNGWADPYNPDSGGSVIAMEWGADGVWRKQLELTPGGYHYLFIVDGSWVVDPTNPKTVDTGRGNLVSVIEVQ